MTGKSWVNYLANLLATAKADGVISKEEEGAIERVFKEMNANKADLKEAKRLNEMGDYHVTPTGRYSERIRNLEDMIFVALSDSDLCDVEKGVIISFAKAIGARQEQIDTILSESITRFRSYRATVICPNCDHEIPSDWKFCAECGASIQAKTETPSASPPPRKDEVLEESPEEKGLRFEKYVVHKFDLRHHKIKEWRGDKFTNGIYAESSKYPDIEVELSLRDTSKTFAVECKWRRGYSKNGIRCARKDQIDNYKRYSEENGIPVFLVIGVGRSPENPDDVFIVPLNDIKDPFLSSDFLEKYGRLDKNRYFFFDSQKSVLR
jgi:rRNA maturation endonuclease Nob1